MTTEQESWQTQLQSPDPAVRVLAAENLSYLGADAAFAAVDLVQACADEEARDWAVAALEEIAQPPSEAESELANLANAPNPLVAYWAVTLLGRLGPTSANQQGLLLELATDESNDLSVRERAVWAIGKMGHAAQDTVQPLNGIAKSRHSRLASLAHNALEQVQQG